MIGLLYVVYLRGTSANIFVLSICLMKAAFRQNNLFIQNPFTKV